jgi:excisionase family DNA binding protein
MQINKLTVPSEGASALALQAARALAPLLAKEPKPKTLTIRPEDGLPASAVTVPLEAFELFVRVLEQMAAGNSVMLFPYEPELTTQQAADLLNVSRPYLVRLIDNKKLPSRKVGTHRRIRMDDLLTFRANEDQRRQKMLDEMTAESQKMGLEY